MQNKRIGGAEHGCGVGDGLIDRAHVERRAELLYLLGEGGRTMEYELRNRAATRIKPHQPSPAPAITASLG